MYLAHGYELPAIMCILTQEPLTKFTPCYVYICLLDTNGGVRELVQPLGYFRRAVVSFIEMNAFIAAGERL